MLNISFFAVELAFTIIWLLTRLVVWKRQGNILWKREAVLLLMYINLAVILRFVFFPLRVNLIPLVHLFDYASVRDIVWNVVGNAAMFVPSGIVLPIVYRKLNRFWKVAAYGALISLCIEILQLPFASRASDVDDIILNTLGVALGYGIYAAVRHFKR